MKKNSIQLKIVSLIIMLLAISLTVAAVISIQTQKENLLSAARRNVSINANILIEVISEMMLQGEAPIAQDTMNRLKNVDGISEIAIYRLDGSNAFNDTSTINKVNNYQDDYYFETTDRISLTRINPIEFQGVIDSRTPVENEITKDQTLNMYFPLHNYQQCQKCHELSFPPLRGISKFSVPLAGVYKQIDKSTNFFIVFFSGIGIGLALLLIGSLRRIILQPIRIIGKGVETVESGDLESEINLKSNDELGILSIQINNMIQGLREKNSLLIENKIFETRIEESKKYLDNIQEGLLLLNPEFRITEQYSLFIEKMFQRTNIAGKNFIDFLFPDSEKQKDAREELFQFCTLIFNNPSADMEMFDDINPLKNRTFHINGKKLIIDSFFQRIMDEKKIINVMVIFTDKTRITEAEEMLIREKEKSLSEIEQIAAILKAGPEVFEDLITNSRELIKQLQLPIDSEKISKEIFRKAHTIKGSARYLQISGIEKITHSIEDILASKESSLELSEIIQLLDDELNSIEKINKRFKSFALKSPHSSSENIFLSGLQEMADNIAEPLGKRIKIVIHNDDEKKPELKKLQPSILHILRNAIDHGIEPTIERVSLGKSETGTITISLKSAKKKRTVVIIDDGSGINFKAIEKKAIDKKLINHSNPTKKELLSILFSSGFSSRTEVSNISGRGIGLDAVKEDVKKLNGKISVYTSLGKGTKFTIIYPV